MRRVAIALLAGFAAFVLLLPTSGIDTIPPQCRSAFGYNVPCEGPLAVAVGTITAGVVWLILGLMDRWRAT